MSERQIMLYLHVHQPYRVSPYTAFDMGTRHDYFKNTDEVSNEKIFRKVAEKSYLPTNRMLLSLLQSQPKFSLSLSITGTFIEQCEAWGMDVLKSFQELVATGRVDIVSETYHHSLAFFYSRFEFEKQVLMHREKIQEFFGITPQVFRNTELAYNNQLGEWADDAGYKGVILEGWDDILGWKSPNYVYSPPESKQLKMLLKNYRLSDDIAFRFSNQQWAEWPLTSEKYISWLDNIDRNEKLINLCMDYETFGEHQWEAHGIFDFMKAWIPAWLETSGNRFVTASQAATENPSSGTVSVERTVTWADTERDLSAWLGNSMQREALRHLYDLEEDILRSRDHQLMTDWRLLQTSDHVYYMCTKWFTDGDVHAYFSPYSSPYDAFMYFMNAIRDLRFRLMQPDINGGEV